MKNLVLFLCLTIFAGEAFAVESLSSRISNMSVNWGTNPENPYSIGLSNKIRSIKKKKQVTIAVVDTGIDPAHPLIKNNLVIDTTGTKATSKNFGVDFSKGAKAANQPYDQHGHGTHIAGIIKSVFPQANILVLKYYNPQAADQDNLDSTIKALEYAVEKGVDIINYSSGGAGASISELRVLKKAEEKGILVVAAAGNHGSDIDQKRNHYFPASYGLQNILTVINHDQAGKLNVTSNFGANKTHVSAPGSRIKSALPNNRMGFLSGTSQSTAFVSGMAAIIKSSYPKLNSMEVKKIIIESAQRKGQLSGKCLSEGMVSVDEAISLADKYQSSVLKKRQIAQQ